MDINDFEICATKHGRLVLSNGTKGKDFINMDGGRDVTDEEIQSVVDVYMSRVWKNPDEKPDNDKQVSYMTANGKMGIINITAFTFWPYKVEKYHIVKWAYSSSLLPQKEYEHD